MRSNLSDASSSAFAFAFFKFRALEAGGADETDRTDAAAGELIRPRGFWRERKVCGTPEDIREGSEVSLLNLCEDMLGNEREEEDEAVRLEYTDDRRLS